MAYDEYDRERLGEILWAHIERVIKGLNEAKEAKLQQDGMKGMSSLFGKHYDDFHIEKVGNKFAYLNRGSSGCFLIERATGELFNIKGYGVPDYNKKKKADIGNIATVDPAWLFTKRWTYLRGYEGRT